MTIVFIFLTYFICLENSAVYWGYLKWQKLLFLSLLFYIILFPLLSLSSCLAVGLPHSNNLVCLYHYHPVLFVIASCNMFDCTIANQHMAYSMLTVYTMCPSTLEHILHVHPSFCLHLLKFFFCCHNVY